MNNNTPAGCYWIVAVFALTALPAWVTHVIVCISDERWIFLLAGAICAPVGVIHGWGVWFGFF